MNKFFTTLVIIAFVVAAYLVMIATSPTTTDLAYYAANNTDNTSFPATYHALRTFPIWSWFIPGVAGIGMVVINLKRKD